MKAAHPDIVTSYSYVDAMALDMVRRPWDFDVMVMENMFGDILSDLAGGLVDWWAAWAWQPALKSATQPACFNRHTGLRPILLAPMQQTPWPPFQRRDDA